MFNTERKLTPSWELVRPSLDRLRQNSEAVIIIVLLPALLVDFGSLMVVNNRLVGVLALLVAAVWRLLNLPVSYYLQTKVAGGKTPSVGECYNRGLPFWFKIVGFEIWFAILVAIGFILLIIPGLIMLRRYFFTPFYIISKNLPISQAMTASRRQTLPVSGWVWGMFGVVFAFAVLSAIVTEVPFIGPILAALVSLIYFFGPALRWQEVKRGGGKKRA